MSGWELARKLSNKPHLEKLDLKYPVNVKYQPYGEKVISPTKFTAQTRWTDPRPSIRGGVNLEERKLASPILFRFKAHIYTPCTDIRYIAGIKIHGKCIGKKCLKCVLSGRERRDKERLRNLS